MKETVAEVPTCAKPVQPAPWQRSIKYCEIVPPDSADAVQERLICTGPAAVAARFAGAEGELCGVVELVVLE